MNQDDPQGQGQSSSSQVVLQAQQVGKVFYDAGQALTVLDEIDFAVHAGEMLAIMGASGSGKSTLLHILGLLDKPTTGSVWVQGQSTVKMNEQQLSALRNQYFGFVYQFHHLLPEFNATDNVAMPLIIRGQSRGRARQAAQQVLDEVGLAARAQHFPNQLSGGERQRVAIARALVTEPLCVLADEPTGNLDAHIAQEVFAVLKRLNAERGTAFLLVTHDESLAALAHRQYTMQEGTLSAL